MTFSKPLLLSTLVLILSACNSAPSRTGQSGSGAEPAQTEQKLVSTSKTPPQPTPAAEWTATEKGIGPIRAGMTLAEAEQAVESNFKIPDLDQLSGRAHAGSRVYGRMRLTQLKHSGRLSGGSVNRFAAP